MNAQTQSAAAGLPLSYTLFSDVKARSKQHRAEVPWGELVQHIHDARTYKQKSDCPLISLGTYGDRRSNEGALRHIPNLTSVDGAEGDYDGERVAPEEAQKLLQDARIEAVIYTSPSHLPAAPRWRVLVPFVEPHPPRERRRYVGRLNRILGGILSGESSVLSQSFYIGRVEGREYKVFEAHGRTIDQAEEIEPLYPDGASDADQAQRDETTDSELRETFARGENRRETMKKLSARWAARGMEQDDIAAALYSLLDTSPGDTAHLRADVDRLARSAVAKFGETRRRHDSDEKEQPPPQVFHPERALIGLEPLLKERPLPPFVIAGILPTDVGTLVAPGGTGKSTFCLLEAIHIILGKPFLGRQIARSGPVLFITAEDSRARIEYRLFHLCKEMGLTDEQRRAVAVGLLVEDLVGQGVRFVEADRSGNLNQSFVVDQLIEQYADKGLVLINCDPQNYFGPGERFVNDGEAAMMATGLRIVRATGAALRYVHHTGKANSRDKVTDQYAGRGGSAGSDNGRFTQVLQRWEKRIDSMDMPGALTDEDFQRGRVLSFNAPKVSDAEPAAELLWLRRRGWGFEVVEVESDSQQIIDQRDIAKLVTFLREQLNLGTKHTKSSLDGHGKQIGIARERVRDLMQVALQQKIIVKRDLPKEECVGGKDHYYEPSGTTEAVVVDAPRKAPEASSADYKVLNAVALSLARTFHVPVAPGVVADLAAQQGVGLGTGESADNPAKLMGGILYRTTGKSGETVAHCSVEGGPPEKVTVRRSGQKGAWRYQFFTGAEAPPESADGM